MEVPYYNLPVGFKLLLLGIVFGGIYLGLVGGVLSGVGSLTHFLGRM